MRALDALRIQLEWGADEALDAEPLDRTAPAAPRPAARPSPALPASVARPTLPGAPARAEALAAAAETIEALQAALAGFTECPLAATATNLVFADGNPDAGLVFVGEAPGEEEDLAGRPFVGASGRFLDRMLASIGIDRTVCRITNLIPWRPPGNRNPTDAEIVMCLPFLRRHLALLRPTIVVTLGALSTQTLGGTTAGILRLRGTWRELALDGLSAPVAHLPMLHPAYLLRTPARKKEAWADLLKLRERLDQSLPQA